MSTEITGLNELSAADISDNDELVIYDVSAGTNPSKKVKRSTLLTGVAKDGGNHNFGTSEIENLTALNATLGFDGGATLQNVLHGEVSLSPISIAAGASEVVTATLTDAVVTDQLVWALTGELAHGLTCQAWISAANTVSFKFYNTTNGSVAGATYGARVTALRLT
ncbi:hypothetical protein VWZ88_12485 [Phaeobacter sp. JH20_36]|uniref:hypothetical protein n=1 Tax=unclassified Phaeobacter TaxID=2621772 RepID=UPI003A8760FD